MCRAHPIITKSLLGDDAAVLCWLRRAARNRHRHAIEQASRDGVEVDAHERAMLISTQVMPVDLYDPAGLWGDMSAEEVERGLAVRSTMASPELACSASSASWPPRRSTTVPALSFIRACAGGHVALRGELRRVRVGGPGAQLGTGEDKSKSRKEGEAQAGPNLNGAELAARARARSASAAAGADSVAAAAAARAAGRVGGVVHSSDDDDEPPWRPPRTM